MFQPSAMLQRIKPSPTMQITQAARVLRESGKDVIALSAGEPDFQPPAHVQQAVTAAMAAGASNYTAADGTSDLKAAIQQKFLAQNGLTYDADQIVATPGGKFLVYAAMMASLNPGDQVIVPAPYWVSYPDIVRMADGNPMIVPCGADQGFKMTATQLEAAITPLTKWVILNSPNNPTGAVYSKEDLAALAGVLDRHPNVWVLTDDIYEHLIYDGEFTALPALARSLKDRTLIVNGCSKAYAMTGWRLGFGAGPAPLMAAIRKLLGQTTSNPSSLTQAAAVAALIGDHSFLDEWRRIYRERRDLVVGRLKEMPGLSVETPPGAFYVFPSAQGLIGKTVNGTVLEDDVALAEVLLNQALVATVPGTAFGAPGHLRLSYATDTDSLRQAMDRMAEFCAAAT